MTKPLCFVLMPFGRKPDASGTIIDFDAVYGDLIKPAIIAADLDPLRADDEMSGGIIDKATHQRLILCDYAVADLTTADANVFYGIGVRHAVMPTSTVLIFGEPSQLPFNAAPLHALPYAVGADGTPDQLNATRNALIERLRAAQENRGQTSPLHELLEGFPDIRRLKTDVFRDRVQYAASAKKRLAEARDAGANAIRAVEQDLGDVTNQEAGVVIDLFLSYRAVKAWEDMIALVDRMPRPLRDTTMVREQLALALNRNGQGEKAERVLLDLIDRRGPSSETHGILGRVYKDRWEVATKRGDPSLAAGLLDKAIEAYLQGFEADWRDAYPGINAVTLMTLRAPPDERRRGLIPIVTYAVERRIATGKPDYWDHATLLELAVLGRDETAARRALNTALASARETWEPETTARNLRLIRETREKRGTAEPWMNEIEDTLAGT